MFDSVLANHVVQALIKVVLVIGGGMVAGVGGGMEGPLVATDNWTLKGVMVVLGAGSAALGGFLLIIADRERPGLVADVRRDLAAVRDVVDLHAQMTEREEWRIDCDNALQVMLQAVENALLASPTAIVPNIRAVLSVSIDRLLDALRIVDGEDYTVSVFRRDAEMGVMRRIAEQWYNQGDTLADDRDWEKREGFTGQAWANCTTLGIPDALAPEARQLYKMPPRKRFGQGNAERVRPDDERYRSFACVPIMVGADQEPWGILTVTSDEVGRFDAVGAQTRGADAILVLKLAAALFALAAAAGMR